MQNCKKLNKYVQARLTYIQEVPDWGFLWVFSFSPGIFQDSALN
jgi:hypothetical protein